MLPPAWFLLSLVAATMLHWLIPGPRLLAPPYTYVGVLLIVGGLVFVTAPARAFDHARTTINPFGQPTVFLGQGWYRFTRNPMYLGMVLATLGVVLLLGTATPLLAPIALLLVLDRRFVRHEEATLRATFGAAYVEYCGRVRRWL
jgi:protein-S-isoprenylcysteine O-methyltransferase Ste14